MATKTETVDVPAEPTRRVEPVETPSTSRGRGLAIAGIVGGAVVAAGAFFAGGVALGANLPHERPVAFTEVVHEQGVRPLEAQRGPQSGPQSGPQFGDRSHAPQLPEQPAPGDLDSDEPDAANP